MLNDCRGSTHIRGALNGSRETNDLERLPGRCDRARDTYGREATGSTDDGTEAGNGIGVRRRGGGSRKRSGGR